jgi:hypothetical protein
MGGKIFKTLLDLLDAGSAYLWLIKVWCKRSPELLLDPLSTPQFLACSLVPAIF